MRILIVDDHDDIRNILRRDLVLRGFEVVGESPDGADAVEKVATLDPDVVVMDVMMPVSDGVEATKEVKARWPHVEVLGFTALSSHHRDAMLEAGASEVFDKTKPDDLIAHLESLTRD